MLSKVMAEVNKYDIRFLAVSMCIDSYKRIKNLAAKYTRVIPSFGIHPWNARQYANQLEVLDTFLSEANHIGEIGLDKKFLKYASPYKDQLKVFEYIVSYKNVIDKFLNMHTSGAEIEVYEFLKKYQHTKFIVHWYAGNIDVMYKYS